MQRRVSEVSDRTVSVSIAMVSAVSIRRRVQDPSATRALADSLVFVAYLCPHGCVERQASRDQCSQDADQRANL